MFTGLVQSVGRLTTTQPVPAGRRLTLDVGPWNHRPAIGDSISINGCCLTISAIELSGPSPLWSFVAIPETLEKTTLGRLTTGSSVNLEHAVSASTPLGGHIVQGHVDGVATVARVQTDGQWRVTLKPPSELMDAIILKGSVALDGVSLTVASVDASAGTFDVALIPQTLEATTLASWQVGNPVNIETDILTKTVVAVVRNYLAQIGQRDAGPAASAIAATITGSNR
jgi:riboflavin synthase